MKCLVFDFETANPSPASACAIGMVELDLSAPRPVVIRDHYTLIKPPPGPFRFTSIHGISARDVMDAPRFGEFLRDYADWFEGVDLWVGHNIAFDLRVLRASSAAYGFALQEKPTACTVRLSRNVLNIKPANLANVCRQLSIPLNHHHAMSDARATAQILTTLVEEGWRP